MIDLAAALLERDAAYVRRLHRLRPRCGRSHGGARPRGARAWNLPPSSATSRRSPGEGAPPRRRGVAWRLDRGGWPSPWVRGGRGGTRQCAAMVLGTYGSGCRPARRRRGPALPAPRGGGAAGRGGDRRSRRSRGRWPRAGIVSVNGAKMAKSTGILVLVDDVLADSSPAAIRLLCLHRPADAPWSDHDAALQAGGHPRRRHLLRGRSPRQRLGRPGGRGRAARRPRRAACGRHRPGVGRPRGSAALRGARTGLTQRGRQVTPGGGTARPMSLGLTRTKPIEDVLAQRRRERTRHDAGRLSKQLGPLDLMGFGIGIVIGTGIFTLTGVRPRERGPAIAISFPSRASCALLAALCYSELASSVPTAGSAYTYAYATMGEIFAWIVGWDLVLEFALGAATRRPRVVGLPGQPVQLARGLFTETPTVNIGAVFITFVLGFIAYIGIRESARVTARWSRSRSRICIFVIVAGAFYVTGGHLRRSSRPPSRHGTRGSSRPLMRDPLRARPLGVRDRRRAHRDGHRVLRLHRLRGGRQPRRGDPHAAARPSPRAVRHARHRAVLYIGVSFVLTGMVRLPSSTRCAHRDGLQRGGSRLGGGLLSDRRSRRASPPSSWSTSPPWAASASRWAGTACSRGHGGRAPAFGTPYRVTVVVTARSHCWPAFVPLGTSQPGQHRDALRVRPRRGGRAAPAAYRPGWPAPSASRCRR